MTPFFNWFNAAGARDGGRVYSGKRLRRKFDRTINSLLKKSQSIKDNEWQKGMYYPTKWDPLFSEYMTMEKLFHYPVVHMRFHVGQISSHANRVGQE